MDVYFTVIDPVGFFVFVFGPGLVFWIMVKISQLDFYRKFEDFSLLGNKLLDKIIVVFLTGIVLNVMSKTLIIISIFAKPFLPRIDEMVYATFAIYIPLVIMMYIYSHYRPTWLRKIIDIIILFPGILPILLCLLIIYERFYIWSGTIFESMSLGVFSLGGIIFYRLYMLLGDFPFKSKFFEFVFNSFIAPKTYKKIEAVIIPTSILFLMFVAIVFLEFIPTSTIYNIQSASPLHYSVLVNNCLNSTINTTLVLVNTLDRDISITSIEPEDSLLAVSTPLPVLLKKKEASNYDLELNMSKLIESGNGNFIRVKTTEGIIPVDIPINICR